jgi:acetyltransferase-like isoleucine patch superfamily enzyme
MKNLINKLIQSLGKSGYKLDNSLKTYDLTLVIWIRFVQFIRGAVIRPFFKKSSGILFLGRRVVLKHKHLISLGKTITIGDNVEINALSQNGIFIGNNVTILRNSIIECTGNIKNIGEGLTIGNHVGIAQNCFIQVRGKVNIGDYVIFGPYVKLFSENHDFKDTSVPIVYQGETRLPVTVENNVWLGTNCTILGGVTIGEGSIIAAGAIVNKDIPPYSIAAGIPAKVIKSRI